MLASRAFCGSTHLTHIMCEVQVTWRYAVGLLPHYLSSQLLAQHHTSTLEQLGSGVSGLDHA